MNMSSLASSCLRSLSLFAVLWLAAVQPLAAQDRPTVAGFVLAPPLTDSTLSVWGTTTLDPGDLAVALGGSYARHPLSVARGDETLGQLIGSVGTLELMATVGILPVLDFSIAVPGLRLTDGSTENAAVATAVGDALLEDDELALGDIRLTPRVSLVERKPGGDGVGLALIVPFYLPTGDKDVYASEGFRVEGKLAFDGVVGPFMMGANAGYMVRPETELLGVTVDDTVTWGVGAGIRIFEPLSLLVDVSGRINIMSDDFGSGDAPTELLGALRLEVGHFLAQFGAGPGLVGGLGEPEYRMVGAIGYVPLRPPGDEDDDGVDDDHDGCVDKPEDRDKWQDEDGCPDPDNDGDGVIDGADRCPSEAEDPDNFESEDGCPDVDNDRDAIADTVDACPDQPGPPSREPGSNGCPDQDGDGIADAADACPAVAGVASGEAGKNGCPADLDGDGILDTEDACPDAAGEGNPDRQRHGCPKARVERGQIKILERIEFVSGKAVLAASSTGILEAVQAILTAHPEISAVSVEGHTDNKGAEKANETLSRRRAESVKRWLVARGIPATRLEVRGFGETRPIDTNDTPEGRAANRRVEFHIQGAAEAPPPATSARPAPLPPAPPAPPAPAPRP
jgi:outer membrane protein OmpA-like peptidoglycan-associated protein